MKKQTRITLIALITILILVVLGSTIYFYVQKYAYAEFDDLTSDYIVNFNQMSKYVNYSYSGSENVYLQMGVDNYLPTTLTSSHKYFYKFYIPKSNNVMVFEIYKNVYERIMSSNDNTSGYGIFTNADNISAMRCYVNNAGAFSFTLYLTLIDVTEMFGSGNEPDLTQCMSYFTSEYYSYNAGTPMPFSVTYLDGYINGVNDTMGTFSYKLVTESIQSSMQAVNYNNYYGEITAYQNYVRITGTSDKVTAGYMPLLATIETGTHFKITGGFSHNDGHASLPITIAYLGSNGVMIEIQTKRVTGGGNTPMAFEFDAPSNINGFYVLFNDDIDSPSIFIYKFECEILIKDVYALVETAYQNGYGKAKNDYLPGNEGYNEIFNAGKQYAITHNQNNAWGSAWDFIESAFTGIGSIFTIQLLPGVPLSVFILVPLMISLIFFIVKLVKGGG